MKESHSTKWRKNNPDKWRQQQQAYKSIRNKLRRQAYGQLSREAKDKINAVRRQQRLNQPDYNEKARTYARLNVLRKCGMSLKEARDWYDKANKKCQVCGSTEHICIDHCHEKMVVRGMLCSKCNAAIGLLQEDVGIINKLIEYVKGFKD